MEAKAGDKKTMERLGDPKAQPTYKRILDILDSKEKVRAAAHAGSHAASSSSDAARTPRFSPRWERRERGGLYALMISCFTQYHNFRNNFVTDLDTALRGSAAPIVILTLILTYQP